MRVGPLGGGENQRGSADSPSSCSCHPTVYCFPQCTYAADWILSAFRGLGARPHQLTSVTCLPRLISGWAA